MAALTEHDPLDDLDTIEAELDALEAETDLGDHDQDDHNDPPAPAPRTRRERAHRDTRSQRTATKDALCDLIREALGAKIGHDVDRLDVALDHLDNIAANLPTLRATIATEHANRPRQDDQP